MPLSEYDRNLSGFFGAAGNLGGIGIYDFVVVFHRRHDHTQEIMLWIVDMQFVYYIYGVVGASAALLHLHEIVKRIFFTVPVKHSALGDIVSASVENHGLEIVYGLGRDIVDCRFGLSFGHWTKIIDAVFLANVLSDISLPSSIRSAGGSSRPLF